MDFDKLQLNGIHAMLKDLEFRVRELEKKQCGNKCGDFK